MKFSVVITTYNRLNWLRRAVESALNQTIPCEVVIADDNSSDGTEDYSKSLGNRVVYHRNAVNSGHSVTVNAGVKVASGDWIKLVDDDDYLAPDCLETMAKAIAACPQAVICSCQAFQVDINNNILGSTHKNTDEVFYIKQEDIHYAMLIESLPFGTPIQVAFQKEAFLKTQGWESYFDGNYDDINSWLKVAQYGDAVFLNKYLTYRMVWPGAYNAKLPLEKRFITNIKIKEKIYSLVSSKHKDHIPSFTQVINYLKLHWFLVGLKHQQTLEGLKLAGITLVSIPTWLFWLRIIYTRKFNQPANSFRLDYLSRFDIYMINLDRGETSDTSNSLES